MNTTIGTLQIQLRQLSPAGVGPHNMYYTRFVSPPLYQSSIPANTAWKYSIACRASTLSANFPVGGTSTLRVVAYVWRPSTSTKIGNIIDGASGTTVTEAAAGVERSHNITFSGAAVSGMQNGDVLVCEVWFPITQASGATGYNCDFYYDGTTVNTTDITVTSHASYIETPDTLNFTPPATNPTRFYFHDATNSATGLPTTEQSTLTADIISPAGLALNKLMDTSISTGTSQQIRNNTAGRTTSQQNHYFVRFVSPPVYQPTIAANTWTYNFATRTTVTSANFPVSGNSQPVYVNCYVWRPSDSTKVGTILDGNTASTINEPTLFDPTVTNHVTTFTGVQVTGVQNGDVICFEVWFRVTQAGTTAYNDDFGYDGTVINTINGATVTSPATFIETPEQLNLTAPTTPTRLYFHQALNTTPGLPTTEQSTLVAQLTLETTTNRSMDTTIGTSEASISTLSLGTVTGSNYYFTRFVSPPLDQSTIAANNWKYSIACRESNVAANFPRSGTGVLRTAIYLWRPSTQTKVGGIADLASTTSVTEGSANQKKSYNVTSVGTGGTCAPGDVIISEIWFQIFQDNTTQYTDEFFYDGTTATETDTTVTSHASFIETPETLVFQAPAPGIIDMTITTVKNLVNKFITKALAGLFNVQSSTPAQSATSVPVDSGIQILLTDAPTPASVNTTNVKLLIHSSGVEVISTVSLQAPQTIIITPSASLANDTEYRISLPAGGVTRLSDSVGLSNTFTSTFITESLITPPGFGVQSVIPSDGSVDVSTTVSPQVLLDSEFFASSATSTNIQLLNDTTLAVIPNAITTQAPNGITLNPTTDLALNTTYRIFLPSGGIKRFPDNVGLTDDYVSTFTTVITVPPTPFGILTWSPGSGATNIVATTNIIVTPDAPVLASSVTTTNCQLLNHQTAAIIPSAVTYNSSTNEITINPTSDLSASTVYRISFPAGGIKRLSDSVGLTNTFTSTFTTAAGALIDNWGTTWLYPTASGGRVYHAPLTTGSNRTLASGQRDGTDDMIARGDSSWTVDVAAGTVSTTGPAPRLYFYSTNTSLRWENCEITGYYQRGTFNGTASEQGFQGFEMGNRGQHEDGGTNARTYYTRNPVDGRMQRLKEEEHPSVLNTVTIGGAGTFPYPITTWIGVKYVLRNMANGGVHIESWRDTTDGAGGGTWTKTWEFDDNPSGSWGGWPPYVSTLSLCRCASFFFRTDNMTNFRVKKISAHAIDPLP